MFFKNLFFLLVFFASGLVECDALTNKKYYRTVLENGNYISTEISKEDYDSVQIVNLNSLSVETEYKMMSVTILGNKVNLSVSWKKTPNYKSYDVIALMSEDVTFSANSIFGEQKAIVNGSSELVRYNMSTQNVKIFNNGIGISMNLINNAQTYDLTLRITYYGSGKIWGNYRHAQANISFSQAQNYYLNNGNIIFNNSSINNKYDNINPVWVIV